MPIAVFLEDRGCNHTSEKAHNGTRCCSHGPSTFWWHLVNWCSYYCSTVRQEHRQNNDHDHVMFLHMLVSSSSRISTIGTIRRNAKVRACDIEVRYQPDTDCILQRHRQSADIRRPSGHAWSYPAQYMRPERCRQKHRLRVHYLRYCEA